MSPAVEVALRCFHFASWADIVFAVAALVLVRWPSVALIFGAGFVANKLLASGVQAIPANHLSTVTAIAFFAPVGLAFVLGLLGVRPRFMKAA